MPRSARPYGGTWRRRVARVAPHIARAAERVLLEPTRHRSHQRQDPPQDASMRCGARPRHPLSLSCATSKSYSLKQHLFEQNEPIVEEAPRREHVLDLFPRDRHPGRSSRWPARQKDHTQRPTECPNSRMKVVAPAPLHRIELVAGCPRTAWDSSCASNPVRKQPMHRTSSRIHPELHLPHVQPVPLQARVSLRFITRTRSQASAREVACREEKTRARHERRPQRAHQPPIMRLQSVRSPPHGRLRSGQGPAGALRLQPNIGGAPTPPKTSPDAVQAFRDAGAQNPARGSAAEERARFIRHRPAAAPAARKSSLIAITELGGGLGWGRFCSAGATNLGKSHEPLGSS